MDKLKIVNVLTIIFLLFDVCSVHGGIGKKLLKLSKTMNKKLDRLLEMGDNESPVVHGCADVPDHFEKVSSYVFIVDGKEHAQEAHFDHETKEAILTSPAHSGYTAITKVITKKNDTHPSYSLTCHIEHCYYEFVHDELFLDPESFLEHSTTRTRKIRTDTNTTVINYIKRSGHREITDEDEEYQNLTENMKSVVKGRKIFVISNSTVSTEPPSSIFTFANSTQPPPGQKQGACIVLYGCLNTWTSCTWNFKPNHISPGQSLSVHNIDTDEVCAMCCNNADVPLSLQYYVKCDDIKNVGPQAMTTAIAVTAFQTGQSTTHDCTITPFSQAGGIGAPYTKYDPACDAFGMYFGTCVDDAEGCPDL